MLSTRHSARHVASVATAAALALGATACDGNAQDDLDNIEENVDEGADEVGEAVEDAGEELQDENDE